jgi:5-methylcytosine-specific restriction endonuclease McrA
MTTSDPRLWTKAYRRARLWVLDRDRHVCRIRGPRCTTYATEVDHITARADGGDVYDPANMRAACRACNGWLAARRTNAMRYRNTVAVYQTRL